MAILSHTHRPDPTVKSPISVALTEEVARALPVWDGNMLAVVTELMTTVIQK